MLYSRVHCQGTIYSMWNGGSVLLWPGTSYEELYSYVIRVVREVVEMTHIWCRLIIMVNSFGDKDNWLVKPWERGN